MAISNGAQQFQSTHNFINLDGFTGSGEVGRYKDEVIGVLVGIEPRGGFYPVTDRRTGEVIQRPNSWTAHFEDGSMWSWPTYVDETTHQVMPWSRFDPSINLALCVKQRKVIHVWKDDRKFSHLELVDTQVNMNPLPVMAAATAPWEE